MYLQILPTIALTVASLSGANICQTQTVAARATPVEVGDQAPDFTLVDQQGGRITLSSGYEKVATVLVFYRGSW